jgi:hypothetical protein
MQGTLGNIKGTIFRKVRTETILKIYNTLVLPTFLYGSENWTLAAPQRRKIEAAEMKLLRPLAGYTLYDLYDLYGLYDLYEKSENGNYFENIQHTSFTYIFILVRKLDSNSHTKTKN